MFIRSILTAIVVVMAFALSYHVAWAEDPADEPEVLQEQHVAPVSASVTIGETTIPATVGQRISGATAIGAGAVLSAEGCEMPVTTISGQMSEQGEGSITLLFQPDCSISVEAVSHTPSVTAAAKSDEDDDATLYFGMAKSELNDFIWIDLTAVYASMKYYDYGNMVAAGFDATNWCRIFPDGWYVISCDTTWWPYGPTSVYNKTEGTFDHLYIQPARHWQMARFYAGIGWGSWACAHHGSVWGPVHWTCRGEWEEV